MNMKMLKRHGMNMKMLKYPETSEVDSEVGWSLNVLKLILLLIEHYTVDCRTAVMDLYRWLWLWSTLVIQQQYTCYIHMDTPETLPTSTDT